MTVAFGHIRFAVEEGIATITLWRPEKLNAASGQMIEELLQAFELADADDAVGAVIVTGEGRAFCSGADLTRGEATFVAARTQGLDPAGGEDVYGREEAREPGGEIALRLYRMKKPVIAAINGGCAGMGASLPLPMDIRLASEAARFGFVYARRGMVPEVCSSFFLPRIVGIAKALEWCYSGRLVDAQEALRERLVSAVYPPEDLMPQARLLARQFIENSAPVSIALTRQMLWRGLEAPHPMEAHRIESRATYSRARAADVVEGVRAYMEKRLPVFPEKVSTQMPDFYPWWDEPRYS
ncbi:crotonase/enoyl-CoA hydratase family protein [Novosphingobium malaysiense]|uniref:Enoyl-CoA hydratase n=1 Tax=Novosphingobium malaysiense TaxID=1348853 RepID=A0A0B1ZGE8_9SPHN|nr:crotonase/enoyl-CoA hydratase family protein [Novosphingobium malaysiense]KHK90146.1 enoyl-CoA hydratase [Novosphingobium malaysiense]